MGLVTASATTGRTSPESEVPRNGRQQPLVVPLGGGKPVTLSRTTTFIDCLDDKSNLEHYHARHMLRGLWMKPDLLDGVLALDFESGDPEVAKKAKAEAKAIAARAGEISGVNDKRERGTVLHGYSELVDQGLPLPDDADEDARRLMAHYMMATLDMEHRSMERFSVCPKWKTGGTPDRKTRFHGPGPDGVEIEEDVIVDLKTGGIEYSVLKIAMQLSIYADSYWYDHTRFPVDTGDEKAFKAWKARVFTEEEAATCYERIDVNSRWGLVIHLPSDGDECTLHWVDLEVGRKAVAVAQQVRATRTGLGKVFRPVALGAVGASVTHTTEPEVALEPESV